MTALPVVIALLAGLTTAPPTDQWNVDLSQPVSVGEMSRMDNSKLAVYRAGIDVFLDSGAVYDHGRSLGSADFKHGAGIGFFLFVAGFGIKVDFAHNLRDNFRVHFSTGFRF